jgi:phospholipid transport system substrate-binding protein
MRRRSALLLLAMAAVPAAQAEQAGPAVPIAQLNDALLRIMRLGQGTPFAQRAAVIRPVIEQVFDLPQILRISVGPRWNSFPPAEQTKLLEVFTRYTVASYVANFDSYNGQRFEILPQTRAVGADQVVTTRLVPRSGEATRIDYQMRRTSTGWRVVDVLVDGSISRVAVQRSDFRSLLAGGGPERLISSLERKVASLQSGNS